MEIPFLLPHLFAGLLYLFRKIPAQIGNQVKAGDTHQDTREIVRLSCGDTVLRNDLQRSNPGEVLEIEQQAVGDAACGRHEQASPSVQKQRRTDDDGHVKKGERTLDPPER